MLGTCRGSSLSPPAKNEGYSSKQSRSLDDATTRKGAMVALQEGVPGSISQTNSLPNNRGAI